MMLCFYCVCWCSHAMELIRRVPYSVLLRLCSHAISRLTVRRLLKPPSHPVDLVGLLYSVPSVQTMMERCPWSTVFVKQWVPVHSSGHNFSFPFVRECVIVPHVSCTSPVLLSLQHRVNITRTMLHPVQVLGTQKGKVFQNVPLWAVDLQL